MCLTTGCGVGKECDAHLTMTILVTPHKRLFFSLFLVDFNDAIRFFPSLPLHISLNYIKQLGLKDTMHKRRRRAEMAFQIDAIRLAESPFGYFTKHRKNNCVL